MMGKLFAELRRRNVFRVAGVYLVVAWLVTQVVASVAPMLGLPPVFGKAVLLLLAAGFPIALVFAWAFEMTPEGVRLTANVPEGESIAPKTGRKLDYVIIGGLTLVGVMIIADRLMPEKAATAANSAQAATAAAPSDASIAVLPFADMSPAGDQEYFSDGIAEEILNVLARMPDLKVAGRTSSFRFKNQNEDMRIIGEQLGVAHILEGSVRKQGERVRITAQLVKAADGFHLWSQTFDRDLTDIFAVQDEISLAVADALSLEMGARPAPAAGPSSTTAHDLYLRARQLLAMRNEASLAGAAVLFEAATVLDPAFADAWSGRARALSLLSTYSGATAQESEWKKAIASADRAIELAPGNAEAYSARGYAYGALLWDWQAARENVDKSVSLAPNDAEIANFAGDFYRFVADGKKALHWEGKAVELDPLFNVNERDLGITLFGFGRCGDAVPHLERAVELGGGAIDDVWLLAHAQICAGETDAGRRTIARLKALTPAAFFTLSELESRLALKEGRLNDARAAALRLQSEVEAGTPSAAALAVLLVELGDDAGAARWFEESYRRREYILIQPDVFKLPEQWGDHPLVRAALDKPELNELFEIRRKNLAAFPREKAAQ